MNFKPLRVLKEYGGTRITMGRDFSSGLYLIEKSLTTEDEFVAQLIENEMRIYESLHHRHIVKYFGEGRQPLSFLIEYSPSGSLEDYVNEHGTQGFPLSSFLAQILTVLAYLHGSGIVHNDINDSNFLVFENSRCKLADFAMAGYAGTPAFPTRPDGFRIGTAGFRFPGTIEKHEFKNDLYGLGMLIYRLVTGNPVDKSMNLEELEMPYPDVITRCLRTDYSSVGEIMDHLELSPSPEFLH